MSHEQNSAAREESSPPKAVPRTTRPIWNPREIYVCSNPECCSKVLIIASPRTELDPPKPPRCVCGGVLEFEEDVCSVQEGFSACSCTPLGRDPNETPE